MIQEDFKQHQLTSVLDNFTVETKPIDTPPYYEQKMKTEAMYLRARTRERFNKQKAMEIKYKIEMDSLKEAIREIMKNKVLSEWQEARMQHYARTKSTGKAMDRRLINTQEIDFEVDECIMAAFTETVNRLQESVGLNLNTTDLDLLKKRKPLKIDPNLAKKNDSDDPEYQPATQDNEVAAQRADKERTMRKMESRTKTISNYRPSETNMTPKMDKATLMQKRMMSGNDVKALPLLRHASSVQLNYSSARQRREEEFEIKFRESLIIVARELNLKMEEPTYYACRGIVENMRRNKGVLITGPISSGKTQIIKLCTIALKRTFNVTIRSSFITPCTFTTEELYGPTQAFDASVKLSENAESLQKSVFQIILDNYFREKVDLKLYERNRLI